MTQRRHPTAVSVIILANLADSLRHGSVEEKVLVSHLVTRVESHRELNDNGYTAFLWPARDLPDLLLRDCHDELDDLLGDVCLVACVASLSSLIPVM